MTTIPTNPDTRLRRKEAADALRAAGFPVSDKTLATKATRCGGPPYALFGRVPLYTWSDCLNWAQSRLSPPRRHTSESDVQHTV
jgi:hypothetical protein